MEVSNWVAEIVACTQGTQLGAIARCALESIDFPNDRTPRFVGKASITSDGFIMCSFVTAQGESKPCAFVGSVSDLERTAIGVADHLELVKADRLAWFAKVREWIATDWRANGGLRLA